MFMLVVIWQQRVSGVADFIPAHPLPQNPHLKKDLFMWLRGFRAIQGSSNVSGYMNWQSVYS
jgi:hypothetical protein